MENIYMPRYHLYPTNPQILHHLMLELFVRSPKYNKEDEAFFSMMPSGPVYKYGGVLADQWKQVFHSHPPYTTLILIAFADLPSDVSWIVTTDVALHSFFWTIQLFPSEYASWMIQSSEMFALYAKPIEAQIPFIRAYKHHTNVAPYIVNLQKDKMSISDVLDTILSHHGNGACVVFVQPDSWVEKIMEYVESR